MFAEVSDDIRRAAEISTERALDPGEVRLACYQVSPKYLALDQKLTSVCLATEPDIGLLKHFTAGDPQAARRGFARPREGEAQFWPRIRQG
jgi:hypothetical protein